MKAVGMFLLLLGVIGLVLNLVLWLPSEHSLLLMVLISVVCLVAVWGGGRLSQPKTELEIQRAGKYKLTTQPAEWSQPINISCPKCGCQIMPGQQFCGVCGSSLVSYCARCGAAISEPSRFCGKCGVRLS